MAAAYAALVSLMNVIDNIQNHPRFSISIFHKRQAESLVEKLDFLLDFIESNHSHDEMLESQITSAVHAAEDVIESHVVDQIHSGSISVLDLQTVMEDMDSVKDKVVNVKEERGLFKVHQQYSMSATSSTPPITSSGKSTTMVGFDDELTQLLDALTGRQSSLQIIPILGMGGIGKTTLATNAYENRLILSHFDVRAWATISQEYIVKDIFSKLLPCQSNQSADEFGRKTEQQLAQQLYQSLIGRRYLIILDDIWSTDVWDKIKFFFPDDNNGSRIILTTRLSDVAVHFGSSYFSKKFLDEDTSWKLFSEKAFLQEGSCPPELEQIAKKIVKKCGGLPLLIVVIGGLLRKSSKTQELWESVSKDINLIPNLSEEEQNLDILSMSYSHLPAHLKPCFLYMGIFPEDHEISVSKLIKLWIAEGFIKPNKTKSLEEVAERYFKDLVDRNLLLVHRLRKNGKIRSCTIHDLLRDLCIKAAEKEKFLYLIEFHDSPRAINEARRILFHENCDPPESAPLARSLLGKGRVQFDCRLLRVWDRVSNVIECFPMDDFFNQVNLRYVYEHFYYRELKLPSSMSLLWNVQSLKISDTERFVAPSEIWSMPQIRHLEFRNGIYLPDPPLRSKQNDGCIILKNLQTLKAVENLKLSEEVCKRIPNVKKLRIGYKGLSRSSCYNHLYNIGRLHKLESLTLHFGDYSSEFPVLQDDTQMLNYIARSPLRNLKYPTSLNKLTLHFSDLDWEDVTQIGWLPNLEVLRVLADSVRGSEWNPAGGGFPRLKYLYISSLELKCWNAESFHFPVLETLFFTGLSELDEIPSGIGEIPTLGCIEMSGCSESAAVSAMRILEEQESHGNEHFRVIIHCWKEEELERFKAKADDFESFKSNNLQLDMCVTM